jgi:hypothetical protein
VRHHPPFSFRWFALIKQTKGPLTLSAPSHSNIA